MEIIRLLIRRHGAYPVVKTWTLISIPDGSLDLAWADCLKDSFISFDNSMSCYNNFEHICEKLRIKTTVIPEVYHIIIIQKLITIFF